MRFRDLINVMETATNKAVASTISSKDISKLKNKTGKVWIKFSIEDSVDFVLLCKYLKLQEVVDKDGGGEISFCINSYDTYAENYCFANEFSKFLNVNNLPCKVITTNEKPKKPKKTRKLQ